MYIQTVYIRQKYINKYRSAIPNDMNALSTKIGFIYMYMISNYMMQ